MHIHAQQVTSLDAFLGACEEQLLRSAIFQQRLPMAVASAIRAFDLRLEAQAPEPLHPVYQPFVANPAALGILLSEILRRCGGALTPAEVGRLGRGQLSIIDWSVDRAALEAINLATVIATVHALRNVDYIEWNVRPRSASARVVKGREVQFKRASLASLQWEFMNYSAFPFLLDLALSLRRAQGDVADRVETVFSLQTNNLAMPEQPIGIYSVDEWTVVLKTLLRSALPSLAAVHGAQTAALVWDGRTSDWLARTGFSGQARDAILAALTFDPATADPIANPLVQVGAGVMLSSPYIVLLRRADVILLRHWAAVHPSQFGRVTYAAQVHEKLCDLARRAGLDAEHDVSYTDLTGTKRDVDVLLTGPSGDLLVIEVKAVLPPKRFLHSIKDREQDIAYAFSQVATALETIDADPGRVIRSGRLVGKRPGSSFGMVSPTYGVGIPARPRFPVIDLPSLKALLIQHSGESLSIGELVDLAKQSAVEQLPITEMPLEANGFRVLVPFHDYSAAFAPQWTRAVRAWIGTRIARFVHRIIGRLPTTA